MAIIERRVPQRSGVASIYPSLSQINCKKVIDIPVVSGRPDTTSIYRYDPQNPLIIRAESRYGVVLDHIRFHLARGIVIDGFDIFPNPYYRDSAGKN
jgi:hypothetical protein